LYKGKGERGPERLNFEKTKKYQPGCVTGKEKRQLRRKATKKQLEAGKGKKPNPRIWKRRGSVSIVKKQIAMQEDRRKQSPYRGVGRGGKGAAKEKIRGKKKYNPCAG